MCIYLSLYISLSFARCVWQIRVPKFATSVITDAKYLKIYKFEKKSYSCETGLGFFLAWNKPDIQTEIDRELWQRHRFRAAANSSGFYRHDSSLGSSTLQFSVLNYSIFGHIPTSSSVYSSSFYAFQMNPRGSGINKHSTRRRGGRRRRRAAIKLPTSYAFLSPSAPWILEADSSVCSLPTLNGSWT